MVFNRYMVNQTMVHPYHGIRQRKKEMYYRYTQQAGWISRKLGWTNKVSSPRLYSVELHLQNIPEKKKIQHWRTGRIKDRGRVWGMWAWLSLGWWRCSVSLLQQCQYPGCDIILEFYKIFQQRKLGKSYVDCLHIICYNFMWVQLS